MTYERQHANLIDSAASFSSRLFASSACITLCMSPTQLIISIAEQRDLENLLEQQLCHKHERPKHAALNRYQSTIQCRSCKNIQTSIAVWTILTRIKMHVWLESKSRKACLMCSYSLVSLLHKRNQFSNSVLELLTFCSTGLFVLIFHQSPHLQAQHCFTSCITHSLAFKTAF